MAEMGRQAEAAMGGDEGALASIKARLFGDSQAGGEHIGHMAELVSSGRQEGPGWTNYVPYGAPNQDPTALVGWRPDIAKFYRDIVYPEQPKIHELRDDMVGRRAGDDPIQFNPFIDSITSKIRTAAESGMDGPVDIWGHQRRQDIILKMLHSSLGHTEGHPQAMWIGGTIPIALGTSIL